MNVDLHAMCAAEIVLETAGDDWVLFVSDAGPATGMDHSADPEGHHLGLRAMRQAASRVDGRVDRYHSPGGGFVVRATVPTGAAR